jgi:hypothetical protein
MSHAATFVSLSVTPEGCDMNGTFTISYGWFGLVDDGNGGNDRVGMIAYDGDGTPISSDWGATLLQLGNRRDIPFGPGNAINPVDQWPLTVEVYDITAMPPSFSSNTLINYNDILGQGAPLLGSLVFNSSCANPVEPTPSSAVPGCDTALPLTSTSVVGAFVADTRLYWGASLAQPTDSTVAVIPAGKAAWVLGQDSSGEFYRIVWQCQKLWVPVDSMGPNYDAVWKGTPLPTGIVN